MNGAEVEIGKHEKGLEFEKKVAEFFRKKGYNKVLLRERIEGKSGIKHEIDVLVFDNLDQNKMLWACQCKYWNAQIGIKEIGEWIQTCKDIGVKPAFISLSFSSNAKKYAEANGVYLITDEQLGMEPSQVIGEDFLSWKERLDSIDNDIDKILFCLKSIYQTEILQNAERAKNEPDEELRFEEPCLFKLFRDPNDQRLTKFLIHLNKIQEEYGPRYAFGSLESFLQFKISSIYTNAFNIPSEVGEVNRMVLSILEKMNVRDLEPFRMNWGDKCRIFLESWKTLGKIPLMVKIGSYRWYETSYITNRYHEGTLGYEIKGIILGKPTERWTDYIQKTKRFWRDLLTKRNLDILRLNKLFDTDLNCLDDDEKCPNLCGRKQGEDHLLVNLFKKANIIMQAHENNLSKIEKIISDLKTEQK
jgi:predicted RecB family endonuclease